MDSRQMAENRSRRMQHGQTVPTWRALFALRRNGYAIDMVCVPAPEQTGTGFRLSCYIPDIGPQGTTRPAISNSEILRDMYGEIRATLLEELMVRQGFPHSSHSNSLPEPCSSNHRQNTSNRSSLPPSPLVRRTNPLLCSGSATIIACHPGGLSPG